MHPWILLWTTIKEQGRTQKQFAILVGKKVSEVNELIKGKRNITIQRDYLLHKVLWTPLKYRITLQIEADYQHFLSSSNLSAPDLQSLPESEPVHEPVPEIESLPKTEPIHEPIHEIEISLETEPVHESVPEIESVPESEPVHEPIPEVIPEPESKSPSPALLKEKSEIFRDF